MTKKNDVIRLVLISLLVVAGMMFFSSNIKAATINKTITTLMVGEKVSLKITGATKTIKWKSSNAKVAKVSSAGKVTALKKGTATITATFGTSSKKCQITVNDTMSVSDSEITISKPTTIKVHMTASGKVYKKIGKPSVLDIQWGSGWEGDYLPVKLIPKKDGDLKVTFSNSSNSEIAVVKVHVKDLKPDIAFTEPVIEDGASQFIAGQTNVVYTFKSSKDLEDVVINYYDSSDQLVYFANFDSVESKMPIPVVWNGKNVNGEVCYGDIRCELVWKKNVFALPYTISVVAQSPFGAGDGTYSNPYRVSNLRELEMIADYNGSCFALDSNIDINYQQYQPNFTASNPFKGTFSGAWNGINYTISNYIGYNSLFAHIGEGATVKDLIVDNWVISDKSAAAIIANDNYGVIENCTVSGLINGSSKAAMVVENNYGNIANTRASGDIILASAPVNSSFKMLAGGIAINNTGMITSCESDVKVDITMKLANYSVENGYDIFCGGIVADNAHNNGIIVRSTSRSTFKTVFSVPEYVTCDDSSLIQTYKIDKTDKTEKNPEEIKATTLKRYIGYIAGSNEGMIAGGSDKSSKGYQMTGVNTGVVGK